MDLRLTGKRALITGASRGIGRAIAATLHSEGSRVVINGRNRQDLDIAAMDMPGVIVVQGDMTRPDEAKQVIETAQAELGGIDALVCNVGSGQSVPPGEEWHEEWQRVFALNFWSTTNAVEAARAALDKSNGSIVCVSSICGSEVIPGAPLTYSAAKAALNAYVRGIARPLGKLGVRINAVAPGNILFHGSVWSRKLAEDADAVQAMLKQDVALAKLGTPEDVAGLVAYLISHLANNVSGAVWAVDGGQLRS